jgi:hypothetical protein
MNLITYAFTGFSISAAVLFALMIFKWLRDTEDDVTRKLAIAVATITFICMWLAVYSITWISPLALDYKDEPWLVGFWLMVVMLPAHWAYLIAKDSRALKVSADQGVLVITVNRTRMTKQLGEELRELVRGHVEDGIPNFVLDLQYVRRVRCFKELNDIDRLLVHHIHSRGMVANVALKDKIATREIKRMFPSFPAVTEAIAFSKQAA